MSLKYEPASEPLHISVKLKPQAGDSKEVVLTLYDWERVGKPRAIGEIKLPVCHTTLHHTLFTTYRAPYALHAALYTLHTCPLVIQLGDNFRLRRNR